MTQSLGKTVVIVKLLCGFWVKLMRKLPEGTNGDGKERKKKMKNGKQRVRLKG